MIIILWNKDEINILYDNYSVSPMYILLELLPNRNINGIYVKANRLKLYRPKVDIDLEELFDYYCNKGLLIKQIASIYSVHWKSISKLIPTEWKILNEKLLNDNIIVNLYLKDNLSMTQIADKFNVSIKKIKRILLNNNINIRNISEQIKLKLNLDENEIIDLYINKILSCSKIALILNTTNTTISNILHSNNINLRTQKEEIGGSKHSNWKGGISSERSIIMQTKEYQQWRELVYQKDNYSCQCCGDNKGGNLQAHHINNFSDYIDLRFDTKNGVTLCSNCHSPSKYGSFHHTYGTKNNTKEQLEEYIQRYKSGEFDELRKSS